MPARRLLLAVGVLALILPTGFLLPGISRAVLVADGLLLLAFGWDWLRARRLPLQARRIWPPLWVQGSTGQLLVEVDNGGARDATVQLRETLTPALAAKPRRLLAPVAAGGRRLWKLDLVPRWRGEHWVGPLTARVLGPWGLAWSQRSLLPGEPCHIYPQVRWGGRVGQLLTLARRRRLGQQTSPLQGQGSELYALREYLPGDPLSRIHWRASAHHDRLVSREDTWERSGRLVILLDASRTMAAVSGEEGVGEGRRSKLDHALATALALARVAAARGDAITLAAFSDRLEVSARVRSGGRGVESAYRALYDLAARQVEPAYDLAVSAVEELESRSATVVMLTSVVDLAAAELLRESLLRLERRHRTLLVNLEDPEIHLLARRAATSIAEAFARVSCLEVVLANRRLSRRLARQGVRVVTTSAERLALETLETYLALFRGRRPALSAALRRGGEVSAQLA